MALYFESEFSVLTLTPPIASPLSTIPKTPAEPRCMPKTGKTEYGASEDEFDRSSPKSLP